MFAPAICIGPELLFTISKVQTTLLFFITSGDIQHLAKVLACLELLDTFPISNKWFFFFPVVCHINQPQKYSLLCRLPSEGQYKYGSVIK